MPDANQSTRPGPTAHPLLVLPGYPFPTTEEGLLPWSWASDRLARATNYWLATTRPDGRPHVAPLWGSWVDDALYFDGSPQTRWARNLAQNPAAAVNLESGFDVVIVEGVVDDFVTDAALAERILADWNGKYGKLPPEPAGRGMWRFRPRAARGWGANLEDGTRWTFPPLPD